MKSHLLAGHQVKHAAHPGFRSVAASIARREGVSPARAGAMLAASSRNASAHAKRLNPRLNRV